MNDDDPAAEPAETPPGDYVVGYGRPPVATRFQPGRSGNPRGRPRKAARDHRATYGAAWLDEVLLDEVYRTILLRENGEAVRLTVAQAAVRALGIGAVRGSRAHAQHLFALTERAEARAHEKRGALLHQALQTKGLWADLCRRAADAGRAPPEPPLPHPDDLIIDYRTGTVTVDGPVTPAERRALERLCAERDRIIDAIEARRPGRGSAAAGDGAAATPSTEALEDALARLNARMPDRYRREPQE